MEGVDNIGRQIGGLVRDPFTRAKTHFSCRNRLVRSSLRNVASIALRLLTREEHCYISHAFYILYKIEKIRFLFILYVVFNYGVEKNDKLYENTR